MYKYSKKKQKAYMKNPLLCFLMYNFLTSKAGLNFIKSQSVTKDNSFDDAKHENIKTEIKEFKSQAAETLQKATGMYAILKTLSKVWVFLIWLHTYTRKNTLRVMKLRKMKNNDW